MGNILLVDDDVMFLEACGYVLESAGHKVMKTDNGSDAIRALTTFNPDLVITDLHLGTPDGIAVLKKAKEGNALIRVIVCTGDPSPEHAKNAIANGADDYLAKPFLFAQVIDRVGDCIDVTAMATRL